jgi:hypothetical protein
MQKRVLSYLVSLGVAYLALLLLVRLFETSFIFYPNYPGRLTGDWRPPGLPLEDVHFPTADGVKLHAWWIPAADAEFTFVCFHGNAANIANRAEFYAFLRGLPANVLAVEYRGYGRSEGSPSEAGIYLDGEAAYDYLTQARGVAPEKVIAFGVSLGTAVAAHLATKRSVAGLVLEAPFPSARAVARRAMPFLPGLGAVLRTQFATSEKLARARAPLLVVHCRRDPVIPFSLGEEVFARAPEPKFFLPLEGSCHETAIYVGPAEYREQLLAFLAQIGTREAPR